MVAASTMNLTEGNQFPLCFQLFFSQTIALKVLVAQFYADSYSHDSHMINNLPSIQALFGLADESRSHR